MPLPNNINAYADVKAVLDPALAAGGGVYALSSDKEAIRFRARAYKFRSLAQKLAAAGNKIKNYQPPTPYDTMLLTLDGPAVVIDVVKEPGGELTLKSGEKLRPKVQSVPLDDSPIRKEEKGYEVELSDELAQLIAAKAVDDGEA